ncbi:MAG: ROK family protein [Ignavibacteriaceae bacterium]
MGGTKILAAAINSRGIIARVKKPTNSDSSPASYIKALASIISDTVKQAGLSKKNVKAVCLGVPGSVNPVTGIIGLAPNLGLKNFNIKEKLQALIPYPVLIENDVNLGALGIKKFGLGKDAKDMFVMFIGTGIGGALFFDEKIYRGINYVAGEIGHFVVQKDGPLCGCGNRGCFEAVASRTAITRNILEDVKAKKKTVISKYVQPGEKIKSKALLAAVNANDKVVVKRISEASETIGIVLASITNLLNFDLIILGGGVIEALDHFMMPKIKQAFKDHALLAAAKGVKIKAAKLGDDAALWGGIALAEEFLGVKV